MHVRECYDQKTQNVHPENCKCKLYLRVVLGHKILEETNPVVAEELEGFALHPGVPLGEDAGQVLAGTAPGNRVEGRQIREAPVRVYNNRVLF